MVLIPGINMSLCSTGKTFQLSQCWEMIENVNVFISYFCTMNSARQWSSGAPGSMPPPSLNRCLGITRLFHSPLHIACRQGCARDCQRLLENGRCSLRSREHTMHCSLPRIHCKWDSSNLYLDQPITQAMTKCEMADILSRGIWVNA